MITDIDPPLSIYEAKFSFLEWPFSRTLTNNTKVIPTLKDEEFCHDPFSPREFCSVLFDSLLILS